MSINTQKNGNTQLNDAREGVNDKVDKLKNLGNTKGRAWNKKRRNRSI